MLHGILQAVIWEKRKRFLEMSVVSAGNYESIS